MGSVIQEDTLSCQKESEAMIHIKRLLQILNVNVNSTSTYEEVAEALRLFFKEWYPQYCIEFTGEIFMTEEKAENLLFGLMFHVGVLCINNYIGTINRIENPKLTFEGKNLVLFLQLLFSQYFKQKYEGIMTFNPTSEDITQLQKTIEEKDKEILMMKKVNSALKDTLFSEKREEEIAGLNQKVDRQNDQMKTLLRSIETRDEKINKLKRENVPLKAELETVKKELEDLRREVSVETNRTNRQKDKNSQLQRTIQRQEEEMNNLKSQKIALLEVFKLQEADGKTKALHQATDLQFKTLAQSLRNIQEKVEEINTVLSENISKKNQLKLKSIEIENEVTKLEKDLIDE